MANELSSKKCVPCEGEERHLMADEIEMLHKQIPDWNVEDFHHLERKFKFKDFQSALHFVNDVGSIAEREGHHPDISFGWGYVTIKLFTHSVDGLSENDFIIAAKIDQLQR